jgi:hypothetical protein
LAFLGRFQFDCGFKGVQSHGFTSPSHRAHKCPFITHYMSMIDEDDASNFDHKHGPATIILESEEILDNDEEEDKKVEHLEFIEHLEQIEPLSTPNLSNDKNMSTEAHSFVTIPFETLHEP